MSQAQRRVISEFWLSGRAVVEPQNARTPDRYFFGVEQTDDGPVVYRFTTRSALYRWITAPNTGRRSHVLSTIPLVRAAKRADVWPDVSEWERGR